MSEPDGGGSTEHGGSPQEGAGIAKGPPLQAESNGTISTESPAHPEEARVLAAVTPGIPLPDGEGESPTCGSRTGSRSPSWDADGAGDLDSELAEPTGAVQNRQADLSSLAASRHDRDMGGLPRGGASTSSQCDTTFSRSNSALYGGAEVQVRVCVRYRPRPVTLLKPLLPF